MRVSEIRVKRIRVNQGLGVLVRRKYWKRKIVKSNKSELWNIFEGKSRLFRS